jgi:hypothetical protein
MFGAGSDACEHVTCGLLETAMGSRKATGVGCGQSFDLRKARKYTPTLVPPISAAEAAPIAPVRVEHQVRCDRCQAEPICGVRLRCLHCPEFNLCLPCLAEHGPDHEAEEQWPGRDEAPHIFDVIHEPSATGAGGHGTGAVGHGAFLLFSLPATAAFRLARYVVGSSS